ncbi:MAG: DNA/RNA nuclease SfsA [Methanomicrobiales archaeon]|nr:DNA/RNA nuclease SfsA [Methanomicrobiales archaeon]
MRFPSALHSATFLSRPNRFLAETDLRGQKTLCHVPYSGRAGELLTAGARVYLQEHRGPGRKTGWDLVLVRSGRILACLDTRLSVPLAREALGAGIIPGLRGLGVARAEYPFRDSRIDLLLQEPGGRRCLLEVKSCTLVEREVALFPDAPTERGRRHLRDLSDAVRQGMRAAVLFVIQRPDGRVLAPHEARDPRFGAALRGAASAGVEVYACGCRVSREEIRVDRQVPVQLGH